MPIKITDFEWSQKELSVFITFGLKNYGLKNVDIVCTSSYLKVNFTPYIFELFLCHKIDPGLSSTLIKEGNIQFHLIKTSLKTWETLEQKLSSKEEAQSLRCEALKEFEELEKQKIKKKRENAFSLEQLAISRQISWNEEKHIKQKEFLRQEKLKFFKDNANSIETFSKENPMRPSSWCSEDGSRMVRKVGHDSDEESPTFPSSKILPSLLKSTQKNGAHKKENDVDKTALPAIRASSSIKIRLTHHTPSVPKRESYTASSQEEEARPSRETETFEKNAIEREKEAIKSEGA